MYVTAGPHETFALSVVEAQASGLPVVGVEAGALIHRVTPAIGRLGPVGDAATFARNIAWVAARQRTLATAARAHVEARFSWRRTFQRLFQQYKNILLRTHASHRAPASI